MSSLIDAESALSLEAANAQGLVSVNQAKAKKEDKDKIKLTDLIDKSKASKDERDGDADEVDADIQYDADGKPILHSTEESIYNDLGLRYDDTGADNDQIFVIDGDSLLHEILHDQLLDWTHGGQFLHVVYAFEQYIKRFQEGGRIFRFVFFHALSNTCWAEQPFIQLVRERLIEHLRTNLRVQVNEFENWFDKPFAEFLERVDPAFILVGDGAGAKTIDSSSSSSSTAAPAASTTSGLEQYMASLSLSDAALPPHVAIRSMSLYLLAHHFRVIRLTELSFASNDMSGFQLAMHGLYKRQLCEVGGYQPDKRLTVQHGAPLYRVQSAKDFDAKLNESVSAVNKSDRRLSAVLYALVKLLKSEKKSDASGLSVEDFARGILITTFLTRYLPLDARAVVWESDANKTSGLSYSALLATFHANLLVASIGSSAAAVAPTVPELDVFDGRLLAFVLHTLRVQKVAALGWSASMETELLAAWTVVSKESGAAAFLPSFALKSLASAGVTDLDEATLAKEARDKHAAATASSVVVASTLSPAPAAASSSSSSAPAPKAAKTDDEDLGNWDDEDVDETPVKPVAAAAAPKKAAEEEDVGSWEDISDEDEPKKDAAPTKDVSASSSSAAAASSSSSPSIVHPPAATALEPITTLDNKFIRDTSVALEARLAAHGLLEGTENPPSLTSFAAKYATGKLLDDGMDDPPKPVAPTNKREQRAASRMTNYWEQYSKSLVGGRLVLREVVVASAAKETIAEGDEDEEKDEEEEKSSSAKGGKKAAAKDGKAEKAKKPGKPGAGGGKSKAAKPGKDTGKESIKDKIRREVEEQQRLKDVKKIQGKINIASTMSTLPNKIAKLDSELEQVGDPSAIVALLQLLDWCMDLWRISKPKSEIEPAIKVFVMIHDLYRRFRQYLNESEFKRITTALVMIGFEEIAQRMTKEFVAKSEGKYTLDQVKIDVKSSSFPATLIGLGYNRFQLEYAGPWMLRNVDSAPDERVTKFYPDAWQRNLLDVADANQSALIVAPTSAGKTFISYYVMKSVLAANKTIERSSERGVVVYVAPNKALVNQVSADVYQRYGLVFGTATDDHQDKSLTSEVLITVPSVLEKLLLNPQREGWAKKIRWVIFDEVHLISSAGEGSIWERCLSLIRSPFLALSATVGNPRSFYGWLERLDGLRGRKVHLIVHETRWSDLEKGMYLPADPSVPPHNTEITAKTKFDLRSLTLMPSQWASVRVHPCAAVGTQFEENEKSEFPKEVSFSPRDSLSLYDALVKHSAALPEALKKDLATLAPDAFFPELLINKSRAMEYEAKLKKTLTSWLVAGLTKQVSDVMASLTGDLKDRITKMEGKAQVGQSCYDTQFIRKHFFSLLLELYARDQLPGIIFSNDSALCVKLVTDTLEKLEDMEAKTQELETSDKDSRDKIKAKAAALKALKKKRDQKMKNKQAEEEAKEADEFEVDAVEADTDDYVVDPRFSFIDDTEKMDGKSLAYWIQRTLYKTQWKKSHPLIRALYRGIGVHHGGLVKQYRDLVETLFRGKHLKVVVATSTLALGVNMPARSVTLCGDSKLLTPLQYRQMSGRAGRRGYDNIGHVIFFAVPPRKVYRLLKSPLNDLRGHYPLNTTVSLRMIDYETGVPDKAFAQKSLIPLLREPFFADNWRGSKLLSQITYQFRYALDSLHKQSLLNGKAQAYGLARLATHLHAGDPSNFGFVALLQAGHFHAICKNYEVDKNRVAKDLLQLLAHLFYRVPLPAYLTRSNFRAGSPNLILLPEVDQDAKRIIEEYNTKVRSEFTNYLKTFSQLELGKVPVEKQAVAAPVVAVSSSSSITTESASVVHEGFYQLPSAKLSIDARSPFVASSGHDDTFSSARTLSESVRTGIFLDTKLIPTCMDDYDSRGNQLQLNAYVVDFYLKQHFYSLVTDNKLSDAYAWGLLKNWSLLLTNITTALRTLSVDESTDLVVKSFDHLTTTFDSSFNAIVSV